jgi:ATP-dependent exoDNAse (exonuclease V) beta subunit
MLEDPEAFIAAATDAWGRARTRHDVVAAMSGLERMHEVPFSLSLSDNDVPRVIRGTIDSLVRKHEAALMVVEFKTGRPHAAHQQQLDLYVRAAEALHPGARIEGVLLYL